MLIELTAGLVLFATLTVTIRRRVRARSSAATVSQQWLIAHRGVDQ
jgi:hypothetical protein